MATDLSKAPSLAELQMRKSARRFLATQRQMEEDHAALVSNLRVYLKLNGSGAASRLCDGCGIVRARLSETVNGRRGISYEMARKIAGLK